MPGLLIFHIATLGCKYRFSFLDLETVNISRHLIWQQGSLSAAKKSIAEAIKWKKYYLSQELEMMGICSSEESPSDTELGLLVASILKRQEKYSVDCATFTATMPLKCSSSLSFRLYDQESPPETCSFVARH